MNLPCGEIRGRFAGYAAERLPAAERRQVRDHLASCGTCYDAAGRFDPTLLFSVPASPQVAPEEVERIVSAVKTGIELKQSERRLWRHSAPEGKHGFRRKAALIASAAAVLAAVLLLPSGSRRPAETLPQRAAVQPAAPSPAAGILPATRLQGVEEAPGEATIIGWEPKRPEEPRVVWIYGVSL